MRRDWPTAAHACNSARAVGPFFAAEHAHARAHRAGGDEHHFPARIAQFGHLRHQLFHLGGIRLLPAVREDAGAQLHDHARDVFKQFPSHPAKIRGKRLPEKGKSGGHGLESRLQAVGAG